jgi:hypothetical protein
MGLPPKADGPASSDLISRIGDLYHRTLWRDARIAKELPEELGLKVTRNQVHEIRLEKGRLRRTPDPNSGRSYGRGWTQDDLRRRAGHRARVDDIKKALQEVALLESKLAGQGFVC